MIARIGGAGILLAALLTTSARAADDSGDGQWHFTVTPYIWAPTINASLQYSVHTLPSRIAPAGGLGALNVTAGPNKYLEHLNAAALVYGEIRKGDWAISTDVIYMHVSGQGTSLITITGPRGNVQVPINVGSTARLSTVFWTLELSHSILRTKTVTAEGFVGGRLANADTSVGWDFSLGSQNLLPRSGSAAKNASLTDAIIGLRGRQRLGESSRWYLTEYIDAGAGGSQLTWQWLAGLAYGSPSRSLIIGTRQLSYETGGSLQNLRLEGPFIGYTFRF